MCVNYKAWRTTLSDDFWLNYRQTKGKRWKNFFEGLLAEKTTEDEQQRVPTPPPCQRRRERRRRELDEFLNPACLDVRAETVDNGRRVTQWWTKCGMQNNLTEYIMEKIRNEVNTAYYVRHVFACVEKH